MDSNYTIPSSSYAPPTSEPVLRPADPLLPWMSDALLSCLSPIVMYWIVSMFFHYIDTHNYFEKYRLHTPEEVLKRNHVSRYDVIRDVIIQQIFQFCVGALLGLTEPEEMTGGENWTIYNISQWVGWTASALLTAMGINGDKLGQNIATYVLAYGGSYGATLVGLDWRWKVAEAVYNIAIPLLRLSVAIFILDAWQYFWHRLMHQVPWLYRNIHARHHRLYVPYAFGALYNHPAEGLILDTLGAAIAYKISGMTMKGSVVFFGFCCMKTVDDHCGYKLPFDPLQLIFSNNAAFHDIHHQGWGIKNNFSQPFLICWDRWLGTMYTGGDAAERNQRTRERVHKQIELEAIKREQRAAAPIVDEYAARRALPEEDDTEFMTTSVVNKPSTSAATPETPKPRRRTRTITLADVTGKDVAGGLKDTEKWANDIVGNVSGAKLR